MLYGVYGLKKLPPVIKVTYAHCQLQEVQKSRKKAGKLPTGEAVGTHFLSDLFPVYFFKIVVHLLVPF